MNRSVFTGHGYIMNDNRASGGTLEEADALGCKHCQAIIDGKKWRQDGAFCHACDGPICTHCDKRRPQFGCEIFERTLARAVEEQYRRDQNRAILGI